MGKSMDSEDNRGGDGQGKGRRILREDKGRGEQQRKMIAKMTVTVRGKGKDRENKRKGWAKLTWRKM